MKRLLAIARLNFRQAKRDKIFLGVVFFFLFYLAFCFLLGRLSVGEQEKVLRNAGLVGIELSAVVLIIFSFTFSFYREKDTRILEVYLTHFSRPVYASGKIAGYLALSFVYLFLCAILYCLLLYLNHSFHFAVVVSLYFVLLKVLLVLLFTSIFSFLFSSSLVCLLSSFFLYLACEFFPAGLKIISEHGKLWQKVFLQSLYSVMPNMDKLDLKSLAVYGQLPEYRFFFSVSLYAFIYSLCLWLINICVFQKKEY